jgi:2,5-diketo-D-gluconate reductase A
VTRSRPEENPEENLELFDFSLSDDDMTQITALNRNETTSSDPDTFGWIPDF